MDLVLIATYNEKPNVERLIPELLTLPGSVEVLIVDDNSPDGTGHFVAQLAKKYPRVHLLSREVKDGYGHAMNAGFLRALELGADRIVTMDADFSHDPQDVPRMFRQLKTSDIAIGSRYAAGIRVLNWAPKRLLLSMGANRYLRTVLGFHTLDCTSGFRGYNRNVFESGILEHNRFKGYAFLVEMLYRSLAAGYRAEEVEIVYTERREGQSKMSSKVIFEAAFAPWILKFTVRKAFPVSG